MIALRIKLNKIILFIIRKFTTLLLGNFTASSFENTVRSVIESYQQLENNLVEIKKIRKGSVENYDFPPDSPTYFRREKVFSERYIFKLQDVVVSTHSGLVWTKDGKILQESYGSLKRMFQWNDIRPYLNLPVKKLQPGYDNLYFLPDKPFFHFLLEEIPAFLQAIRQFGKMNLLIPRHRSAYYDDFVELIKLKGHTADVIEGRSNIYCERLIVTQRENYSGFVHTDDLKILTQYLQIEKDNGSKFSDRIYISRKLAPKRKIANESDLEEVLFNKYGFQIIYLEKLSLMEQIKCFMNSKLIVAPHGAGLSHLIWLTGNEKLIELFPTYIQNDCFARLALKKNILYDYVICSKDQESEIIPVNEVTRILDSWISS